MAFEVRTSGPDLLDEENRLAFLRIEDSIRQYAAHSREPIYLVRRPFSLPEDHFVLLWPRGAVIGVLYAKGGTISGSSEEPWRSIPDGNREIANHKQRAVEFFENPYRVLMQARKDFSSVIPNAELRTNFDPALIALFSRPVGSIELHPPMPKDIPFRTMGVEFATARTIVHLPNLLRAADSGSAIYAPSALETMVATLDRAAQSNRTVSEKRTETIQAPTERVPRAQRWKWIAPIVIVVAVAVYYLVRSLVTSHTTRTLEPTIVSHAHPPSEMVIKLPIETELLVSPNQYATRDALDRALSRGEGQRFLPDTEDVVIMDSLSLAKGVYGYFRVNNAWRKGKLLQTLETVDTVTIVKFLEPLP